MNHILPSSLGVETESYAHVWPVWVRGYIYVWQGPDYMEGVKNLCGYCLVLSLLRMEGGSILTFLPKVTAEERDFCPQLQSIPNALLY